MRIIWKPLALALLIASANSSASTMDDGRTAFDGGNYDLARDIFLSLSTSGDPVAQGYMGRIYIRGLGVERDYKKAFYWFEQAAKQGDQYAQANLAMMLEKGLGTGKNPKAAAEWYEKSATQGQLSAQYNLALMYQFGKGIRKDSKKAAYWYGAASKQGDAAAQANLGYLYLNGDGVPEDFGRANELFRRAAKQGHVIAIYNLGESYEYGRGVSKDFKLAYTFYNIAAGLGDEDAAVNRDKIKRKLSAEALLAAQRESSAWSIGALLPGETSTPTVATSQRPPQKAMVGYFETALFSCSVTSSIDSGNHYLNPDQRDGTEFLVLDVEFKNLDVESRAPFPGSVFIGYGGKVYEFDSVESIYAKGWGVGLERLNPLTSLRTKIVYRIPKYMRGEASWAPGRNMKNIKLPCGVW